MPNIQCKHCHTQYKSLLPTTNCPKCGKTSSAIRTFIDWAGVIILIIVIINILVGIGYKAYTMYQEQTSSDNTIYSTAPKTASSPAPTAAPLSRSLDIPIKQLLSAYDANEINADNLYKGKTIQTTGLVQEVKKDADGNLFVLLGSGAELEFTWLQAYFDESNMAKLAQLKQGQRITVTCEVLGLMFHLVGRDCKIVQG